MISILCPTRGRPDKCARMIESVIDTATQYVSIYLSIAVEEIEEYRQSISKLKKSENIMIKIMASKESTTCYKWNMLAAHALQGDAKLLMVGSDDMYFADNGWDLALSDHYEGLDNKIHVYHLQDSRDENGTPHPIVTRDYVDRMGYFVPPIFLHWYVDTWTVEIAKHNNCFTHLKEHSLVHDKPSDKGEPDETHSRIRQWGWKERDDFVHSSCQRFLGLEKKRLKT